ncbi:hypothetical protein BJ741DRAFT_654952 [Chytriomyces cf. hyalinus JEL632]|nr:hypothetical protein BJ741DRAFT_654952 [Chytriomyces cf. hyalinus JEL632]
MDLSSATISYFVETSEELITPVHWLAYIRSNLGPNNGAFVDPGILGEFRKGFKLKFDQRFDIEKGAERDFTGLLDEIRREAESDAEISSNGKRPGEEQQNEVAIKNNRQTDQPIVDAKCKTLFDVQSKSIFEAKYKSMDKSEKLKLQSGKYAEDVMYQHAITFKYIHPMHSFIFCPDDENSTAPFTEQEQLELCTRNKKVKANMFEAGGMFSQFYKKFSKVTHADLDSALYAGHPEMSQKKDPDYWICRLFITFLHDISLLSVNKSQCFSLGLSETWILSNAWRILQLLFHDTDNIYVLGGEKSGLASQERKDASRKLPGLDTMPKRMTGKKGDGYIRAFGNGKRDLGAMEAGPTWEGTTGTKSFIETGTVMPKVLRDILWSYTNRCNLSRDVLAKLTVPGMLVFGEKFQRIELDSIGGYVTRVHASGWKTLDLKGSMQSFIDLFLDIYLVRTLVLENEKICSEFLSGPQADKDGNDDEDDENDFLLRLQNDKVCGKNTVGFDIGLSHPTPRKKIPVAI